MRIKHLIITRYNLHLSFEKSLIDITRDEKWHQRRLELFEKVYLKCVDNSYKIPFDEEYLIFLDFIKENLSRYNYLRKIKPVNTVPPNGIGLAKELEKIIKKNLNEYDLVISTRLDSDDGLAPDYSKELTEYIKKENILENCCLYFDKFVQFNLLKNQMSLRSEKNPNVLSFLNFKGNEFINPVNFNHATVDRSLNTIKIIRSSPMFVQSIHEINIGNQYKHINYYDNKFNFLID